MALQAILMVIQIHHKLTLYLIRFVIRRINSVINFRTKIKIFSSRIKNYYLYLLTLENLFDKMK